MTLRCTVLRSLPEPPASAWPAEHVHATADGAWTARFHDEREFAMGAAGWELTLSRDGRDVTDEHLRLRLEHPGRGFRVPAAYRPWCASAPVLALRPWEPCLHLLAVERRAGVRVGLDSDVLELQWAPRGGLLALTLADRVALLDVEGAPAGVVRVGRTERCLPRLLWLPDGERFLVACRAADDTPARLELFRAADGASLGAADFDPAALVPYDADAYRGVPRGAWSLERANGTRTSGFLLDQWTRVALDPERPLLRAWVLRPVAPPRSPGGVTVCPVEERGVEVELEW